MPLSEDRPGRRHALDDEPPLPRSSVDSRDASGVDELEFEEDASDEPGPRPNRPLLAVETVEELRISLARDRLLRTIAVVLLIIILALIGRDPHPYLPILLFSVGFDLMALNRERRLLATLTGVPPATVAQALESQPATTVAEE